MHADREERLTRRAMLQASIGLAALAPGAFAAPPEQNHTEQKSVEAIKDKLPRTAKVIEEAAAKGNAGQLYLSLNGKPVADIAWGKLPDGTAYTPATLVGWASAVKPTTCACLLKLWDQGKLDLDDKVTKFIPEFGVNGKENVRIRHLLTHTAHLGGYAGPTNLPPTFAELVNKIIQAPREPYRALGANAKLPPLGLGPGYNPAGIIVIAEICRRLYGRDFKEVIRKEVYEPCGMNDSWCGMPLERYRAYKKEGRFASGYLATETEVVKCQPAGGGIGPTRELARFYEMLIGRGAINGKRILSPQAVEAMTTPKTGLGYMGIWGLGLNLALPEGVMMPRSENPRRTAEQLQERYGPHASTRSFGHAGASGMQAFADPEHSLATAFIGRVPISGTIYEDLGLVKAA